MSHKNSHSLTKLTWVETQKRSGPILGTEFVLNLSILQLRTLMALITKALKPSVCRLLQKQIWRDIYYMQDRICIEPTGISSEEPHSSDNAILAFTLR